MVWITAMDATLERAVLPTLATRLQPELTTVLPAIKDGDVRCVWKADTLQVLVQHAPEATDCNPDEILVQLKAALQAIAIADWHDWLAIAPDQCTLPMRLYLKAEDADKPYAAQPFTLSLSETETAASEATEVNPFAPDTDPTTEADADIFLADSSLVLLELADAADDDADTPSTEAEADDDWTPDSRWPRWAWLGTAISVSVASFAAGVYLVTRPCTLSTCTPLIQAEQLSDQTAELLAVKEPGQDLTGIEQRFAEIDRLLGAVPIWSSAHTTAREKRLGNQYSWDALKRLLAAKQTMQEAAAQGLEGKPSATQRRQAIALIRQAIEQVETVPPGSPVYPLARKYRLEFQDTRMSLGNSLELEKLARQRLQEAKEAARKAKAREGTAQSLENWQLTKATWQTAVSNLMDVPANTTFYDEAQDLLQRYEAELKTVGDRVAKSEKAQAAYDQSVAAAKQATEFEQQSQWSLAVTHWRQAVEQLKTVPKDVPQYEAVQKVLASQQASLKRAETQLRVAIAQQKAVADLQRLCPGQPQVCIYEVSPEMIRVQFTPAYEQAVQAAMAVGQAGDRQTLGGTLNHLHGLQTALQNVAQRSGLPLEAYSADGKSLVWGFNPNIPLPDLSQAGS